MSCGIADADNLAWKLAGALHGWASVSRQREHLVTAPPHQWSLGGGGPVLQRHFGASRGALQQRSESTPQQAGAPRLGNRSGSELWVASRGGLATGLLELDKQRV